MAKAFPSSMVAPENDSTMKMRGSYGVKLTGRLAVLAAKA